MSRPPCSANDGNANGYEVSACVNQAVALYREHGSEDGDDRPYCLECLMRRIRVAIDLKGFVLSVMAEPPPDTTPGLDAMPNKDLTMVSEPASFTDRDTGAVPVGQPNGGDKIE